MNILFVDMGNVDDNNYWSGTPFYIKKHLEQAGYTISKGYPLSDRAKYLLAPQKLLSKFRKQAFPVLRHPIVSRDYARQVEALVKAHKPDLIFSTSSVPVADVKTNVPIVFLVDAFATIMKDYYDQATWGLEGKILEAATAQEERAIRNATVVLTTSEWAAQEGRRLCPDCNAKIRVVPLAPGVLPENIERFEKNTKRENKHHLGYNFLFVGVDWERKGGPRLLRVLAELRDRNVNINLDIVGCRPEILASLKDVVTVHGFIDKKDEHGAAKINNLYANADCFVLFSEAEAFGIVFIEAMAFGVPVVALKTGGVTTAVVDGKTGVLFEPSDTPENIAEKLANDVLQEERLAEMSVQSREYYTSTYSWKACIDKIGQAFVDALAQKEAEKDV